MKRNRILWRKDAYIYCWRAINKIDRRHVGSIAHAYCAFVYVPVSKSIIGVVLMTRKWLRGTNRKTFFSPFWSSKSLEWIRRWIKGIEPLSGQGPRLWQKQSRTFLGIHKSVCAWIWRYTNVLFIYLLFIKNLNEKWGQTFLQSHLRNLKFFSNFVFHYLHL